MDSVSVNEGTSDLVNDKNATSRQTVDACEVFDGLHVVCQEATNQTFSGQDLASRPSMRNEFHQLELSGPVQPERRFVHLKPHSVVPTGRNFFV